MIGKSLTRVHPRLIFVCLTNILLITSLVSLVSNSLTEVSVEFEPIRIGIEGRINAADFLL